MVAFVAREPSGENAADWEDGYSLIYFERKYANYRNDQDVVASLDMNKHPNRFP